MSRLVGRRGQHLSLALLVLAATALPAVAGAGEPESAAHTSSFRLLDDAPGEAARGRISIAYQTLHTEGLILASGDVAGNTTTDAHSVRLALDYMLDDRWQAHVAIPFIRKRSSGGPGAHRLDVLDDEVRARHPDARFLDDGRYHSDWQDWGVGVSYHTSRGRFQVQLHAIATLPSHDYPHFANAAIGQNLWKLKLGADFTRQLASSNVYYSAGYSYEIWEEVLGIGLDKHHLRTSAGYLFTPQLSGRVFTNARYGQGRDTTAFTERMSEFWYQHDRLSRHNYAIVGLGTDYRIHDDYSLSLTAATMLWGRTVHDLKYAYEVQLTRSF